MVTSDTKNVAVKLATEAPKEWNKFIFEYNGIACHTLDWLSSIEETYQNMSNVSLLVFDKGESKLAIPAVFIKSRFFGNKISILPFVDVGNPLGNYRFEYLESARNFFRDHFKNSEILVKFNSRLEHFEELRKNLQKLKMEEIQKKGQLILKLTTSKELWDNQLDKRARNDVRMGLKSSLRVKEIKDRTEIKDFFELYSKSMKNFGTPQHSLNFFLNLWKNLYSKNLIKGFNCYKDQELAASIIGYMSPKYIYIIYNVSNPQKLQLRPNDLLYWRFIEWGCENKFKFFDFGQADIDSKDKREYHLTKYKLKWGADFYPKFSYTISKSQGESKFNTAKKIWKKLPLFITKRLGPFVTSWTGL